MDEEKLVKLLEKKFVTKNQFSEFSSEMREFRLEMRTELKGISEDIGELKPSAKSLDKILEKHPIERIIRLEKHSKLPPFAPAISAEE